VRSDPQAFAARNLRSAKEPRFVVRIEFSAYHLYLSSHADIAGIASAGGTLLDETGAELLTESGLPLDGDANEHIEACLTEPSIASQKLNPDQGRAEIGAASFTVADLSSQFTAHLRERLAGGEGLRGKRCRFYLGYRGLDFADFQLVGTQIVKDVSFERGAYRVRCNDIQRAARKDIFDLTTTTLAATLEPTDTTVHVYSTAGFEMLDHGTSYSDAASSTVGYLKIKDEIIRYTGTTATSFTGCTRGVLGTDAGRYVVDGGTAAARREKVTEHVYLEMPGPKLAYAILTGTLYGTGSTLPSGWHLGIDSSLIAVDDFTGIGADLWDTSDDTAGIVLRFEGIPKSDGKAFLETEICRLLGLFMPVYADGRLGLRRMTRVLSDSSGVATLNEDNSVQVGELEHDMESLHNAFSVQWNWNGKEFTRQTTYVDATSAGVHGVSTTMALKFKGLYGGRHTDSLIFKLLDSIRDRYSAPPERLTAELLHSMNTIEVGDVVRVHYPRIRDHAGAGDHIDRAFEVQSVTVNHRTGTVSLDLFGSTSNAASIESPTQATSALPDAFYAAQGTNLATVMTIASGVVSGGPYTLAGGTDLTAAASTWYYDGDLTIPDGVTVNITGNVQLRVKGYLTVNGTINGTGGGWAGVADNGTSTVIGGNPGFVGNSRGNDGIARVNITDDFVKIHTHPCALTQAQHASFPYVQLEVVGNDLKGLPTDLRGTGGGPGGKVVRSSGPFFANGGTGGTGGAGLCTISRGFGIGANARITLSGTDTNAPAAFGMVHEFRTIDAYPGAGGAGGPGSYLCLIDGGLLSVPDLAGRFVARTGAVNAPASYRTALSGTANEKYKHKYAPFAGWLGEPSVISAMDLSFSASRIQYVPAPETPQEDAETESPVGIFATATPAGVSKSSAATSITTASVTAALVGATGATFAWSRLSGSTSISADSPSAATTAFTATGVGSGVTVSFFNDTATTEIYTVDVPVDCTHGTGGSLSVSASPVSVSTNQDAASVTTSAVTASASGGSGGNSFAWAKQSGGSITADSPASATTTFSATGLTAGEARSAVFRCTVTDSSTATAYVDVTVTITRAGFSVALSPTELSRFGAYSTQTTGGVTATAANGAGGYSYAWTKVSGDPITINSPSSATTTFTAAGLAYGETRSAIFRCTTTDLSASTATADISVVIGRYEYTGGGGIIP